MSGGGGLTRRLGRLVLVRHGESMWNVTDKSRRRETRFTGWADVPASPLGREQARSSGRCLESLGLTFDAVFTSLLSRSRVTYEHMLQEMPSQRKLGVPVVASWRLNERHYGALVGLSKSEAEERMGRQKVMGWRRSWELRPPPMVQHPFYHATSSDPTDKAPLFDWQSEIWTKALTIRSVQLANGRLVEEEKVEERDAVIPLTESLQDTADRVWPLWHDSILPRLVLNQNVLVVGHSNTIRAMVKYLDNLSETAIVDVVVPSAIPLVYQFAQDAGTNLVRPLGRESALGMRGRFCVTKELLELNLAASQNLEMSENLDEDESGSFKAALTVTLRSVSGAGSDSGSGTGSGAGRLAGRSSFDVDLETRAGNSGRGVQGHFAAPGWMTFNADAEARLRSEKRLENSRASKPLD